MIGQFCKIDYRIIRFKSTFLPNKSNLFFRTNFHVDPHRAPGWSANVCGHKRWILIRPGFENEVRDSPSQYDVRENLKQRPDLCENGSVLDVIQNPGEIMFVPSNWYHQVHNLVRFFPFFICLILLDFRPCHFFV